MQFSKMDTYIFGIILSFLSVRCTCDNHMVSSMANTEHTKRISKEGTEQIYCPLNDWKKCSKCSFNGSVCFRCCGCPELECYDNVCDRCLITTQETSECIESETPGEAASQISLSIAMAIGIIILLVVLWKMCVTPNYLCFYDRMSPFRRYSRQARARMITNTTNSPRNEDLTRTSVSSIEIRVVARLQNRPPRYESAYNYNQRIEVTKQHKITDEAPPAYDAIEVEKVSPPPYMIDVDASSRLGIDNNSFEVDGNTNTINSHISVASPGLNTEVARATIHCETAHI